MRAFPPGLRVIGLLLLCLGVVAAATKTEGSQRRVVLQADPTILQASDSLPELLDWLTRFDYVDIIEAARWLGAKGQLVAGKYNGGGAPGSFGLRNAKAEVVGLLYPAIKSLAQSKSGSVAADYLLKNRVLKLSDFLKVAQSGKLQPVLDYFAAQAERGGSDWGDQILPGVLTAYVDALSSEKLTPGDVVLDLMNAAVAMLETVQSKYATSKLLKAALSQSDLKVVAKVRSNLRAMMAATNVRKAANIVYVALRRTVSKIVSDVIVNGQAPAQDFGRSLLTLAEDLYGQILRGGNYYQPYWWTQYQGADLFQVWSYNYGPKTWKDFNAGEFSSGQYQLVFVLDTVWEALWSDALVTLPYQSWFMDFLYRADSKLTYASSWSYNMNLADYILKGLKAVSGTLAQLYDNDGCYDYCNNSSPTSGLTCNLNPYCYYLKNNTAGYPPSDWIAAYGYDLPTQLGYELARAAHLVWYRIRQGGGAIWYFMETLRAELQLNKQFADPFRPETVVRSMLRYAISRSKNGAGSG